MSSRDVCLNTLMMVLLELPTSALIGKKVVEIYDLAVAGAAATIEPVMWLS